MSIINQKYLKDENGEEFSPITSAQSVYYSNGASLGYDSGWRDITKINVGTLHNNHWYMPQYRRVGNLVFLRGSIDKITERAAIIFTLPDGFHETDQRLTFCSTNDQREVNLVRINESGGFYIQQSTGNFTNGVNLVITGMTFIVDSPPPK